MTREDVRAAIHDLVQSFHTNGAAGADVCDLLLAYACAVGNDTHGPDVVARHLYVLSLKLTAEKVGREAAAMVDAATRGRNH